MSHRLVLAAILAGAVVIVTISFWSQAARTEATGGNSLAIVDSEGPVGEWSSVALDADDNPVVSYYDIGNASLKVAHCGTSTCLPVEGNTITSPDSAGDVGQYSSLRIDASGNPVVSYYDATNGDLKVLHCGNAACTVGNTITLPDTEGNVGEYTSLVLDSSGNPVISYEGALGLAVLHCGNPNCTSGNVITPLDELQFDPEDRCGGGGGPSSIVLDAVGNPVVTFLGSESYLEGNTCFSEDVLRLLHCGDPNCTSGNSVATVAGPPVRRGFLSEVLSSTSLALDGVGNPVVAFLNAPAAGEDSSGGLRVLHCGDPGCTSGNTIASPDAEGDASFPSLAIDSSGNPVVSYGTSLRILRCGNPTCTSANTIAYPQVGELTQHPSVALDASGRPVVSYQHSSVIILPPTGGLAGEGQRELGVLRCGDAFCSLEKPPESETPTATTSPVVAPATDTPTATAVPPATSTPTSVSPLGDVSCDGVVNPVDAALILQFAAGLINAMPCGGSADVNGDGRTDPIDASLILQFAAGLIGELPP